MKSYIDLIKVYYGYKDDSYLWLTSKLKETVRKQEFNIEYSYMSFLWHKISVNFTKKRDILIRWLNCMSIQVIKVQQKVKISDDRSKLRQNK